MSEWSYSYINTRASNKLPNYDAETIKEDKEQAHLKRTYPWLLYGIYKEKTGKLGLT
jgi:hypothetical protein